MARCTPAMDNEPLIMNKRAGKGAFLMGKTTSMLNEEVSDEQDRRGVGEDPEFFSACPRRHRLGLGNHTQQETPLLDRVCGEVTVTDPAHPLYGQTLPRLPMRIKRSPPQVMVLLPSGRRHLVPRAATNLERPEGGIPPAAPLPVISVRAILPLARLVQHLKQAKEESHAEQTTSLIHPPEHGLPSSHGDLSSASPELPAGTGAPARRPHSARAHSHTRPGGRT